jgi:hypothetical protein
MEKKVKCKLCSKALALRLEVQHKVKESNLGTHTTWLCDDGVCFERQWFCNGCWSEVTKYVDKNAFKTALEMLNE